MMHLLFYRFMMGSFMAWFLQNLLSVLSHLLATTTWAVSKVDKEQFMAD